MKDNFTDDEIKSARLIIADLKAGRAVEGIQKLERLKDDLYAAIPGKQRISRGITWVVQQIASWLLAACDDESEAREIGLILYDRIALSDKLMGVPVFLMGEVGVRRFAEVLDFFQDVADSQQWVVREFAAGGFRQLIEPNKAQAFPWLKRAARSDSHYLRRFASETLRPVAAGRWLLQEPEYSLSVLQLMFSEPHPYPRTSVGNNLSDLSKRHPERIFSIVAELVARRDENSAWIAHRACRNLVKSEPERVLDTLRVDEYHYKDRHFYRSEGE